MGRSVAITAVVAGAVTYALLLLGWSVTLNGPWHDALQRWLPRAETSSPVVLVEGGNASDPGDIGRAVAALGDAGAADVGVLIQNPAAVPVEAGDARLGWPVQPAVRISGAWQLPPSAPASPVVHSLAAGGAPAYRIQPTHIETRTGRRPTLEAAMAGGAEADGTRYRVDYRGGLPGLPRVRLDEAAAGDLLPGVVEGRHVLIAAGSPWSRPRYDAPVAGPGATDAQVHAFALRTLLEGRPLTSLPAWLAALLAALVAAAAGLAVARCQARALSLWIGAGLVGIAAACVAAGWAGGWLLPGTELVLAWLLPAAVLFYQREHAEDALLSRLASAATVRARQRDPGVGGDDGQRWPLLAHLMASGLGVSRLVLLRSRPGEPGLEALAGVNADADAIAARQGGPRQPLFAQALTANAPVPQRQRLLAGGDDELEYLVCLAYGGQTLGYWLFTMNGDDADAVNDVLRAAPVFAERAAELIYLHEAGGAEASERSGKRLSAELQQSLTASERRLALFEEVLGQQETAVAVYDVFGQAVHVNRAMNAIGEQAGIRVAEQTATDVMAALGGLEPARARAFHRQAVAEATPVSLPLAESIGGRRYMLAVTLLNAPAASADSLFQSGSGRISGNGFLISLTDYTSAAHLFELAESLRRFVNTRLRNDLINIQFASDLLVDPRLPEGRRERAAGLLRKAIARADDELDVIDSELNRQTSEGGDVYPLDAVMLLRQLVPVVETAAAERGITLGLDLPSFSTPCLARPNELQEALRAALELVIDGASPGAVASITYHEDATSVTIEARAPGYGMPDERLQLMLTWAERDEPPVAAGLRLARERLRAWGGELTAHAELGEGVGVVLTLRRVGRASETASPTNRSGDD